MKPAIASRGLAAVAALIALCAAGQVRAQVQRNYLNPGFESPALTAANAATGCYKLLSETLVPGWTTTHPVGADGGTCIAPVGPSGPQMEMWRTNFNGVPARSGSNFVELNASASSRMYQNVCVLNGDQIAWRFSHRGRGSATIPDVMDYNIGASVPIVRVSTTSNGTFNAPIASQGTANAPTLGGNGWVDYTGAFTYAAATGTTSMGFESISAGSGNNTIGNFLDNIQIELRPFVEFVQTSGSTPESASSNVPTLRVNGTAFSAFAITVQITGGTATLGTDYTTPGNSATMTVNIPVGQYDGFSAASLFPLPIAVVNDALSEGNETIQFTIVPPTGSPPPFLLSSSIVCGGAPQTVSTYTIVDDEARIAVVKNAAAPVAVAGQPTQFDEVYTVAVSNPTAITANYSLIDTPGFDPDVSIVSAGYARNGGASVALIGGGPWTLQAPTRALAAGATDTYTVTVRIEVQRGGTIGNDVCASPGAPGSGLHNVATATLQATGNPAFVASACRDTPTPVWATLRKSLLGRVVASDQMQVRIRSAGVVAATAITSGAALPGSASTGAIVVSAGNTLQFEESVKANGTGADQAPSNYRPQIACTNATAGSPTILPSGAGTVAANQQQWPAFATNAGDDIDCLITNALRSADLRLTKTNTPANGPSDLPGDSVTSGATSSYALVVTNLGPDAADGAVLTDPAPTGLTCATAGCTATGGAMCPAATGAALVAALQGAGAAIPTLPNGGSVTVVLTCTVN